MAEVGANRYNPNPCTQDQVAGNNQYLANFTEIVNEFINEGGADEKVKSSAIDTTSEYLHDAIFDRSEDDAYVAGEDPLVYTTTEDAGSGNLRERLYLNFSEIPNWTDTGTVVLASVDGVAEFVVIDELEGDNDEKVKITGDDSTADYLYPSMEDQATYATGDFIISAAVVGSAMTDQTLRMFFDSSSAANYSGTGDWFLGLSDNVPTFFDADSITGGGASTIRMGRVTTAITAATGNEATDWGSGQVDFCDDTTGVLSGSPVAVDNDWIGITFGEDYQVKCDTAHSPPRVVTGSCVAAEWTEP